MHSSQNFKALVLRSVLERSVTLQDLFSQFASGEFDDGESINIQTTPVSFIFISDVLLLSATDIVVFSTC